MNSEISVSEQAEIALSPEDVARFGQDPARMFRENLEALEERIAIACAKAGRQREEVRLLPVSKTVPSHILRLAWEAGIRDFGENKVQEAQRKSEELLDLPARWCLIGHLQTNKARHAIRFASEFHALGSERLAKELDRRLEREGRDLEVYVQVNTSGEETKFGLQPEELLPFVERLADYPRLIPKGLMTLAIFSDDREKVRACFRLLRELRDEAVKIHPGLRELSMGMSGDFELAIEEGASVVRVGQAIFGPRPGSDAHYWPGLIPA